MFDICQLSAELQTTEILIDLTHCFCYNDSHTYKAFLIPTKGIFLVVVAPGTTIIQEKPLKPLLRKGFFISEI